MTELYPALKMLHIGCVLVSGIVFGLRGVAMLARSPWANQVQIKRLSYANDSVLLGAGLLLMLLTHQYPGVTPWLSVKLSLLVVYIVLGIFALRRARSYARRAAFFVAAIAVYLFMFSIARTHHPLGVLGLL